VNAFRAIARDGARLLPKPDALLREHAGAHGCCRDPTTYHAVFARDVMRLSESASASFA
jgi:hypothetical protein